MSENTTTGGLVEELRALLADGEHADTCGSVLSPEAGYPCSCWKADLRALLDARASRTAGLPGRQNPVPDVTAAGGMLSSSPEPGAVEALAWLLGVTRFGATPEHIANMQEIRPSWVPFEAHDLELARAILAAGYLSSVDVERVVATAKAEALREAAVKWRAFVADGRCPTCQMASRETVGMVCQTCGTDYGSAAGPERRTEGSE